jgi:dihydroorotate dehydrogenase electron transfer subunit
MRPHRGSIFLEDAIVIEQQAFAGQQFVLRVRSPECADRARPGSFAHIQCDPDILMRRPLSIMRADPAAGEVEFLYKVAGAGLDALSRAVTDDLLSLLGPIGNGFSPDPSKPRKLLLGGGVGIPPISFLAERLAQTGFELNNSLVCMGSEVPFPFDAVDSAVHVPGIPDTVTKSMPLMERFGIPARLASLQGYAGCHEGFVTDLARRWLDAMPPAELAGVEAFACGPEPMLEAAATLARDYGLPCQLCLEEYMACAVGGCAGCAVPVHADGGLSMKRVCVDGPVFEAKSIYPE